jgi:hypothetical protein
MFNSQNSVAVNRSDTLIRMLAHFNFDFAGEKIFSIFLMVSFLNLLKALFKKHVFYIWLF